MADLGEYLRFDATLPADVRELAILVTARAAGQPYEWVAHAPLAIRAGLPTEVGLSRAARGGRPAAVLDERH